MDLVLDGRDSQDSMTSDSDATISTPGRSLGSMLRQIRKESRRPSQQIHCRRKSNNSVLADIGDRTPTQAELRLAKDFEEMKRGKWKRARGTIVKFSFSRRGPDSNIHCSNKRHGRLLFFSVKILPVEGFYRNGEFNFDISVPPEYPYLAPKIICKDKIFHPNFDSNNGNVGLSIVQNDWTPILSMDQCLFALQLLFIEPCIPKNNNNNNNSNNSKNNNTANNHLCSQNENNENNENNNENNDETENKKKNENDFDMCGLGSSNNNDSNDNNDNNTSNNSSNKSENSLILNVNACKLYLTNTNEFDKTVQAMISGEYSEITNCQKFNCFWPCLLSQRAKERLQQQQKIKGKEKEKPKEEMKSSIIYTNRSQSLTPDRQSNLLFGSSNSSNGYGFSNGGGARRLDARSLTPRAQHITNQGQGKTFVKTQSICGKRKRMQGSMFWCEEKWDINETQSFDFFDNNNDDDNDVPPMKRQKLGKLSNNWNDSNNTGGTNSNWGSNSFWNNNNNKDNVNNNISNNENKKTDFSGFSGFGNFNGFNFSCFGSFSSFDTNNNNNSNSNSNSNSNNTNVKTVTNNSNVVTKSSSSGNNNSNVKPSVRRFDSDVSMI